MSDARVLRWSASAELDRPLLVVALEGMFDAAEAATTAVGRLCRLHHATELAEIDPEPFFNFQSQRPTIAFDEGGVRAIEWPVGRCSAASTPPGRRDLVLVTGIEPHMRWRTYAGTLLEVARATGAELVITLGAMVSMAPHTRPLGVVGSAADPDIADRLGLGRPSYQGPTGLVGVLHDRLQAEGLPVVSLRVSVPHYVPGPPNPEATRSLLARLELITGIRTGHAELDRPAREWRQRIDDAVASDDELSAYVRQLEEQVDELEVLPSGDDLAAELEAYLRDRRED